MKQLIDELLCRDIGRIMLKRLETAEVDYRKIAQVSSIKILNEIKEVMHNEQLDDSARVDDIIMVFVRYGIDIGSCRDF